MATRKGDLEYAELGRRLGEFLLVRSTEPAPDCFRTLEWQHLLEHWRAMRPRYRAAPYQLSHAVFFETERPAERERPVVVVHGDVLHESGTLAEKFAALLNAEQS